MIDAEAVREAVNHYFDGKASINDIRKFLELPLIDRPEGFKTWGGDLLRPSSDDEAAA